MRILVTGAGGMLGQDVVAAATAHELCAPSHAELDVTDPDSVERWIADFRPDAVVNCAAWTDVDGAESEPDGARAVNADAAGYVARAAAAAGARLVHVSTDYVFDGVKGAPYVESDATGPRSAYGATKLRGEQLVAVAGGDHAIVRSSWLFGLGGRNFVATMLDLAAKHDEVRVVTDQVGSPTYTGHLARALLELLEGGARGIFHVAGSGACSWHAFAGEIFRRAGVSSSVLPCTTVDMPRPAPRPAYSVLATERPETPILPPWQDGLANYLTLREGINA